MKRLRLAAVLWLAYTVLTYAFDTYAAPRWLPHASFDYFKFVVWLVIPLALTIPTFQPKYFSLTPWRRSDTYLFSALLLTGAAIILLINLFPDLGAYYNYLQGGNTAAKLDRTRDLLLWTCSWLFGWEYLHRYVLLTRLRATSPPLAWLCIPALEVLYHIIQRKDIAEVALVGVAGIILTYWALKRHNTLLPMLVHLLYEFGFFAAIIWL